MGSARALVMAVVFYIVFTASAGAMAFIGYLLPSYAPLFFLMALLMVNGAGFVLFWTSTVEGNVWIARRLGRENRGVVGFCEKGAYVNMISGDFSQQEIQYRAESYKLKREAIFYRGTGTPYILFNVGDSEPINISAAQRVLDSSENTGFLRDMTTLIEFMMRNQMYRLLMIIGIAAIVVTVLGVIFLHFVSIDPVSQKVDIVSNQIAAIGKAVVSPSPVPAAIPSG